MSASWRFHCIGISLLFAKKLNETFPSHQIEIDGYRIFRKDRGKKILLETYNRNKFVGGMFSVTRIFLAEY